MEQQPERYEQEHAVDQVAGYCELCGEPLGEDREIEYCDVCRKVIVSSLVL
ncbi:hypothetical protein GCM10011571_00820 [Marinithermofilum abyssi]|uniref:Uncharacterized protein n=1 Tax=Marinithermofilum abyssi TaxID=1571185 RepID=A0A8J2VDX3_9BACL|nr:hypothetical protein [Marinithermofilum abyssi]GGE03751.1 hypothetical protein GCM10011571_00820 [Marinithermofilum abyssi]